MRLIARLDVKNEFVIKGIQMDGLRKVGDPNALAKAYYGAGADEIVFIDCVASLYNRNNLFSVIRKASEEVFIPITIGGGLRTLSDVAQALDSGADKVALNTAAIRDPGLITEIAKRYGSQCVMASIQTKRVSGGWEAYIEAGREKTGVSAVEWAKRVEDLGAGEILLTSVDRDGTKGGFDIPSIEAINSLVNIPVIASGGYGKPAHIAELLKSAKPNAVCFASVLHYNLASMPDLKKMIAAAEEDYSS